MRKTVAWILLCVVLGIQTTSADDTDIYLPGGLAAGKYLNVVIDTGDTAQDTAICTYGVDCEPPFMSAAAYRHLSASYVDGESVTAAGVFRAVLAAVIEQAQFDDVYLSLLISNHHDNVPIGEQAARGGGTVIAGYRRLREHRDELIALLEVLPLPSAPSAHAWQPKETYFEWLRYIAGGAVALGQNTIGNFGQSQPNPDYDMSILWNAVYQPPIFDENACPELYSLLFLQGAAAQDEDHDAEIAAQYSLSAPVSFTQFLRYLHNHNTDLLPQLDAIVPLTKTWVVSAHSNTDNAEELATAGGGFTMTVNDPLRLQRELTGVFAAVIDLPGGSQGLVFVEDVFNHGKILRDVFMPLFIAQPSVSWSGNIKKLKLIAGGFGEQEVGENSGALRQIVDVNGQEAFADSDVDKGRLRFDALTYWTDVGSLPAGDGSMIPHNSDGHIVSRGGAGQKIDGFANYGDGQGGYVGYFIGDTNTDAAIGGYPARQVFYQGVDALALAGFNADAVTADALKPFLDPHADLTQQALLDVIRWARGQDIRNQKTVAQNWILGEILHSKPLALNYGATSGYSITNPNVRLFFGSGEGAFHILENTDPLGNHTGREVFAFYPLESMAAIRWRYDSASTAVARRYGVDGAPVALKRDRNNDGTIDHTVGDEAIVYFGLRRGGSSYFALDVSNPNVEPRLLWTISPAASGDFDELGLTFSTPLVGKVNFSGEPEDVLVFAGGYNGGWNGNFTARMGKDLGADDDAVGNAIYIVNARTGALVWKAVAGTTGSKSNTAYAHAGLVDSIPSKVSGLLTPNGVLHRLYVGDSGGALWRVDLPPDSSGDENHRRDHWFITKLADLGSDAGEGGGADNADRRFFHAPDIVQSFDELGPFDGVLIQSGNRAEPNEVVVENGLFYIKDRSIESGSALVQAENEASHPAGRYHYADLADQTGCISTEGDGNEGDVDSCSARVFANGWKVRYDAPGEKGLSSPLTDAGRVFVSTYVPGDATSCPVQQGHGRLHVLRLADATAVANGVRVYELGEGIPEGAETAGDFIYIPGGGIDLFDLDNDGVRDTSNLLPSEATKLYRTYWREPGVDPL